MMSFLFKIGTYTPSVSYAARSIRRIEAIYGVTDVSRNYLLLTKEEL